MALARKGTKCITIEGTKYRWKVAPEDEPGMAIVVELWDTPAQRMVGWVEHGNIISPRVVRTAILDALARGWQPSRRGHDLVFRLGAITFWHNP